MADILYVYKTSIYANLTNKCPCRCTFCIRNNTDSVGSADTLWHKHDPSMEDIKKAVDDFDFTGYKELVFCGYGEPTSALDNMLETAKYVREKHPDIKLRLNTNGLSDLIHNEPTAHKLENAVDLVSISLNAGTKEEYLKVTRPSFGEKSFDAMKKFASDCKKYVPEVMLTVVDVIGEDEIKAAQKAADELGIHLRVREYES